MRPLVLTVIALLSFVLVAGCNGQEERVEVPDVIGLNEVEAVQTLEGAGFSATAAVEDEANVPHGTVVEQSPRPGSEAQPGTTITLTIARQGS